MKKDELKVSKPIVKYMKFISSYEDGKYTTYEFQDQSGNLAIHYQLNPELVEDKKAKGLARLFNTKMGKINIGDICVVVCRCREVHQEGYNQSAMYLNVDKIIKCLVKYKTETKYYNGVLTDFAIEEHIKDWNEISRIN